jgi:ABC-type transporter Mla subunit MlaD
MSGLRDELRHALQELELALEAFAAAYDQWSADEGRSTRPLLDALARAEERLDAAREALAAVEARLKP